MKGKNSNGGTERRKDERRSEVWKEGKSKRETLKEMRRETNMKIERKR